MLHHMHLDEMFVLFVEIRKHVQGELFSLIWDLFPSFIGMSFSLTQNVDYDYDYNWNHIQMMKIQIVLMN